MKKALYFVILVLATTAMPLCGQGIGWGIVNSKIHREFPDVARMQTSELAELLNNPKEQRPLLLDVRTKAEFDVSHLAGATCRARCGRFETRVAKGQTDRHLLLGRLPLRRDGEEATRRRLHRRHEP